MQRFIIDLHLPACIFRLQLDADLACGGNISSWLANAEQQDLPFIRSSANGIAHGDPHSGRPIVDRPGPNLMGRCRSFEVDLQEHGGDELRLSIFGQCEGLVAQVECIVQGLEGDVISRVVLCSRLVEQAQAGERAAGRPKLSCQGSGRQDS